MGFPNDQSDSLKFLDSESKDISAYLNSTETKTLTLISPDHIDPIEPLNAIESVMVGPGFDNLRNSCFINAILQCCIHIVPFAEGLQSSGHKKSCKSFIEGFCLICTIMHLFDEAIIVYDGNSIAIIVHNIDKISSCLMKDQQEDAHEFLQCLLDKLEHAPLYGSDFVKQIFEGCLVSRIEGCNCGHYSDTYEPVIDLSLEIQNAFSLENALKSFTDVERIGDGEAIFTCVSCNDSVVIEKQLELDTVPSIASFHLKRFNYNGVILDKIDKHIEFPLELDLRPYTRQCWNSDIPLMYDLYGIVVHVGSSPIFGHYYSFVRSSPDAGYKMDDHNVTRVNENIVLAEAAYIPFYAKKGTQMSSTYKTASKQYLSMVLSNGLPTFILENDDQSSLIVAINNGDFSDYVTPMTPPRSRNEGENSTYDWLISKAWILAILKSFIKKSILLCLRHAKTLTEEKEQRRASFPAARGGKAYFRLSWS
ncbi:ubiquitin carboxyl-terminal hydrolase 20-like [Impatiens glandulifera]|uniref:ubiquitin carboxyl-terminal hydrolase 20-like n=1 Tax=Impatiens glandulifera TaxID=253017 RepID=UPI001FB17493|nr:ubiquitin carboxyl-terminal hydrolase 20-like [Impatiens glandulifera]